MNLKEEYQRYIQRMNEIIEQGQATAEEILSFEEYKEEVEKGWI